MNSSPQDPASASPSFLPHPLRLGVNLDHVATLRNARGGTTPDVLRAARQAASAGADSLVVHLREDRRHVQDRDLVQLLHENIPPLFLEMAATDEMIAIAQAHRPKGVCLVPERRRELTTEGGLDVLGQQESLAAAIAQLNAAELPVSLFVDPLIPQVQAAQAIGATAVELHTGAYCQAWESASAQTSSAQTQEQLLKLHAAAQAAAACGLQCHAGHGLSLDNLKAVAQIPQVVELNIGHALISEALFCGLEIAILRLRAQMYSVRNLSFPQDTPQTEAP